MQVSATKSAIQAYAADLKDREGSPASYKEAEALTLLLGIFKGGLQQSFNEFSKIVRRASISSNTAPDDDLILVGQALQPLRRLHQLMSTIATASRRKDMQALIKLLQPNESVSIEHLVSAVQSARRGPKKRPTMSLDELKQTLDASLGDDQKFKPILAQLKLLSETDFAEVAKTALRVPFRNKKQGLERLTRLHKSTRAHRLKEQAAGDRSAA